MGDEIIIRRAEESDIYSILSITKQAFTKYRNNSGAKTVAALEETYDDVKKDILQKLVFVAIYHENVIGCVRVEINNFNAYLTRFAVGTGSRHNGVGKKLVATIDTYMKKNKVKTISLHTCASLNSLMNFYSECGFKKISLENSRGYERALLVKEYIKG